MLGNVFSPYYAKSRALGPTNPLQFCAMNVAFYGRGKKCWALTERTLDHVERSPDGLRIGASVLRRNEDGSLRFDLRERTAPFGAPLRVSLHVTSPRWENDTYDLDEAGRHQWSPLALHAQADVEVRAPLDARWSGRAYVDTNTGVEPLEQGFRRWDWSRSSSPHGSHVAYDVERRDGTRKSIRRVFFEHGDSEAWDVGAASLPSTFWGVQRRVPSDPGVAPRVIRVLEDAPFYARTLASSSLDGESHPLVHETVDMDRFVRPWVQFLVPFRMRRAA
jgi:carotenoid 1,2-hydratase